MRCVLEAARQGVGLAFVFRQFAEQAIRRGELLALLERNCAPADTFHLVLPAPRSNAGQAASVHRLHAGEEPETADLTTDGKG